MAEYIEREAAIKELMNDAPEQVGYSREDAADCIRYMDAADVAPVIHAHWIEQEDGNLDTYYTCSSCKEDFDLIAGTPCENLYNYCPSCGAKMDEKEDKHEDYT